MLVRVYRGMQFVHTLYKLGIARKKLCALSGSYLQCSCVRKQIAVIIIIAVYAFVVLLLVNACARTTTEFGSVDTLRMHGEMAAFLCEENILSAFAEFEFA